MTIDLRRALYSHCEQPLDALPASLAALQELLLERVLGAPMVPTRVVTYLQGAVTLLEHEHEFRLHVWFDLLQGHPQFPQADRGLICLVQPITADGLVGPVLASVGWLGRALDPQLRLSSEDWVSDMIRAQGYIAIPGAEWTEPLPDISAQAALAWWLARHLAGMTNHTILEERLGIC